MDSPVLSHTSTHDFCPTCLCPSCLSFRDEMHTLADEHFAMFVESFEGNPDFDQALPCELAFDGAA